MTLRLGVLGFSPGNGHPFSFSAIVNGYDDEAFGRLGWPVIHEYLRRRGSREFGGMDAKVEACWMPHAEQGRALADACRIPLVVEAPTDMLGRVDAVLLLRDDAESHWPMAAPFLQAGLPVFVDKPLCTDRPTLDRFLPYLKAGKLMSCSGLRYAAELDDWRAMPHQFGEIRLLRGAVVMDWPRYGVHMLEAAMGVFPALTPVAIQRRAAAHDSLSLRMSDGSIFLIDTLGSASKAFHLDVFGVTGRGSVEINDNFSAFRRTLIAFVRQVQTGLPAVSPEETERVVRTLIAGLEVEAGAGERPIA
ncbi:MAG: Gfo/Idh/MocA family oxidoreductase [Brevundimonas sp.]